MNKAFESRQWSCGSLAAGNEELLRAKMEAPDRRAVLLAQRKALEEELAQLSLQDPVPPESELAAEVETPPATAEELTKTTPVKGPPKRACVPASVKSRPSPKAYVEDGGNSMVMDLQKKLDAAMKEIESLKGSSTGTPSPATRTTRSPPSSAATTPAGGKTPGGSTAKEDGDDGDCDGHTAALKEYNRIDAKLRRLCETKPSGRCNVPESIAKQWRAGGAARDELRKAFMVYELDKDKFVSQMLRVIERKNTQTQEVLSGWFTPEEMKNKLGWSAAYIKDAVAYCKKHGLVKKDKYSDKVYRYFVEYEDKESSAKSRTEMERHTTQGEANSEVELGARFLEPPAPAEPSGEGNGSLQSPHEGDLEVEKKFEEGMLTKMSKITDLISKLDGYTQGDDAERVRRTIKALEAKLDASQVAYDAFVEAKTRLGDVERTNENSADLKTKMRDAMSKASAMASVEAQAKALEKSLKKKKKESAPP